MLLVLILVVGVIGGGTDGNGSSLLLQVPHDVLDNEEMPNMQGPHGALGVSLDVGTPDSILRGRSDIRVAGGVVADDTARAPNQEAEPPNGKANLRGRSLSEKGLDGEVFYISIYCCRNDPGGAYCGTTASGVLVAPGVAACSMDWPLGTRFSIQGDTVHPQGVACQDRGSAVTSPHHLDVFFPDCGIQENPALGTGWEWLQRTGTRVMVEVLE